MEKKLEKYEQNRLKINEIYREQNKLEKDIIKHFLDNKEKFSEIELDKHMMTLKWIYDKHIDYEKLEKLYPDIYVLGLETTFSKTRLLKVMDRKEAEIVLRECTYNSSHYKIKMSRRRRRKNE